MTAQTLTIEEHATRAAAIIAHLAEVAGLRVDEGEQPEVEYVLLRTVQDHLTAILNH